LITCHDAPEQCQTVEDILANLNLMDKPRITALNKIDLLLNSEMTWDEAAAINYLAAQPVAMGKNTVLISAAKKWGLNKLLELISSTLAGTMQPV